MIKTGVRNLVCTPVFTFVLFRRDAVDIWLATLRLAADIRMLNVSRDEGDVAALAPLVLLSVSGG